MILRDGVTFWTRMKIGKSAAAEAAARAAPNGEARHTGDCESCESLTHAQTPGSSGCAARTAEPALCHSKPGSVTSKPETTICVSTCNFNQIS